MLLFQGDAHIPKITPLIFNEEMLLGSFEVSIWGIYNNY